MCGWRDDVVLKRETMKQQSAADQQLGEEENQWDRCLCHWILVNGIETG